VCSVTDANRPNELAARILPRVLDVNVLCETTGLLDDGGINAYAYATRDEMMKAAISMVESAIRGSFVRLLAVFAE
jgi:hypothetical protein